MVEVSYYFNFVNIHFVDSTYRVGVELAGSGGDRWVSERVDDLGI